MGWTTNNTMHKHINWLWNVTVLIFLVLTCVCCLQSTFTKINERLLSIACAKSNNAALGLRLDMHSLGEGWHYCLSVNQSKTSVSSCVQNGIDGACLSVLQWPVIQYEQHFKKDAEISFACLRGKMFAPVSLVSRHHVTGDSCPVGENWNLYKQIMKTCLVLFELI